MDAETGMTTGSVTLPPSAGVHAHHQEAQAQEQADSDAQDVATTEAKQERDAEEEEEEKSHAARHGDITTDDEPQESTADEDESEDEDEEDEEDDNAAEKAPAKEQAADIATASASEAANPTAVDLSDSESMLRMMRSLPEREARRHEQFRRSHFERGAIKRSMAQAIQECSATDKKVPGVTNVMAIVMAGMTKVFVGEITAQARRIMEQAGETGPIRPRHLREAHRKYYKRRSLARGRTTRRLLR